MSTPMETDDTMRTSPQLHKKYFRFNDSNVHPGYVRTIAPHTPYFTYEEACKLCDEIAQYDEQMYFKENTFIHHVTDDRYYRYEGVLEIIDDALTMLYPIGNDTWWQRAEVTSPRWTISSNLDAKTLIILATEFAEYTNQFLSIISYVGWVKKTTEEFMFQHIGRSDWQELDYLRALDEFVADVKFEKGWGEDAKDATPLEHNVLNPPVVVHFRRFKEGDVIALFPYEPGTLDPTTCCSYQRMGQSGSADYTSDFLNTTNPANPEDPDVKALIAELEDIGFILEIQTCAPTLTVTESIRTTTLLSRRG